MKLSSILKKCIMNTNKKSRSSKLWMERPRHYGATSNDITTNHFTPNTHFTSNTPFTPNKGMHMTLLWNSKPAKIGLGS